MNVSKLFFFVIVLLYFSLLASAQKINGISFVASKDSIKSHHDLSN